MTTKATSAQGVLIQRGDGAGTEVFTTIAEVLSFTGPTQSSAEVEVTSFDSAAKEFIAGLRDGGSISFDMNFVASNAAQQGLQTDMNNAATRNFKLILPDNTVTGDRTTITFAAVITQFTLLKGQVDQALSSSVTLKLSGAPTVVYSDNT